MSFDPDGYGMLCETLEIPSKSLHQRNRDLLLGKQ